MPASANVNSRTVVHAKSGGVAMSFPDVCKTPVPPGATVPIPYPNVAQSADTANGSPTVTIDGKPIMLKDSYFSTSTGDEPGAAKGVVSSQVKGKAYPAAYSFDVKVDGRNVFRLLDLMTTNAGSNGNSVNPAEAQPPIVVAPNDTEHCKRTTEKMKPHKAKEAEPSWESSGIVKEPAHRDAFTEVAKVRPCVIYARSTKGICGKWIQAGHRPKPHTCIRGGTITEKVLHKVQAWLDARAAIAPHEFSKTANLIATSAYYSHNAIDYLGIAGNPVAAGIKPLKSDAYPRDRLDQFKYENKWITGDYDLYEVLKATSGCDKIADNNFNYLRIELNKRMEWDGIQHGAQAQWVPTKKDKAKGALFDNMNSEVHLRLSQMAIADAKTGGAQSPDRQGIIQQEVTIAKGRNVVVIDEKVTIIGSVSVGGLDTRDDVVDALICRECDKGYTK